MQPYKTRSQRRLRRRTALLPLVLVLALFTGCKDDETADSPAKEAFLARTEYGLYPDNARPMVYLRYGHQIARTSDGRQFRLQTDDLSQVVACTFSADPAREGSVEGTLRTIGVPKAGSGNFMFRVERTADGKCWLWDESSRTGLIVPAE